jgi:hypothetical protein
MEGGIRISDPNNPASVKFYSEGHKPEETVVTTDDQNGTMEYNAIVLIAKNFSQDNPKSTDKFQRWTYNYANPKAWVRPAAYTPLPGNKQQ